eukprot:SAG11_NODE_21138_length_431_cov_1.006024_1_plen_28_part_10
MKKMANAIGKRRALEENGSNPCGSLTST